MTDEWAGRIEAIAHDRRHGAAELARQCLELLAEAAEHTAADSSEALRDRLQDLAARLIACRPSMTPVARLVTTWLQRSDSTESLTQQRALLRDAARALIEESRVASHKAAAHAADLLHGSNTLVTHSYSSTVAEAIVRLPVHVRVVFSESRPLQEGYRLAQLLSQRDRHGTLVTDAQLGAALARADAVLVGADSILADGSLVNKAGTLLLAATAAHFDVPFYGCCESYKFRTADMPDLVLEQMSPAELGAPGWRGVDIENTYFDITPPALMCGCITEAGLQVFPGYREGSSS